MKLGIRYKLLIGFTLLVSLSLLIQAFGFFITRDYIEAQITENHLKEASDAANAVGDMFNYIDRHAGELSRIHEESGHSMPGMKMEASMTKNEFATFAGHVFAVINGMEEVTFLTKSGRESASYDLSGQVQADKLSIELPSEELTSALSGKRSISRVYYQQGDPYINVFYPLYAGGNLNGAIKMKINLSNLWEVVAKIRIGQSGFAYIIDDNGIVIAHPDKTLLHKRHNFSSIPYIHALLVNTQDHLSRDYYKYINHKDQLVLAQGTKIPVANWFAIAEQPEEEAYAFLNTILQVYLGTLVGSLILLLIIALVLSESLTKPILQLKNATKEIISGNLNTHITVTTKDEIGDLASSFNNMANNLRDAFSRVEQDKNVLAGERNKMAVALSSIADAVIAVDLSRNIIIFNPAAEKITGYTVEEVIGKPIETIIHLYDKTSEIPAATFCPISTDDTEGNVFNLNDIRLLGKNKKQTFVNVMVGRIQQGIHVSLGCLLVLHDISSEKELEDMKIDFVSMAAHELRTPLTSIRGYLSVLRDSAESQLNEEQKMFLQRINIASDQLMSHVDNLLNVARVEKGALTLHKETVDWIQLVQKVVNDLQDRAKQRSITLTFEKTPDTMVSVDVDSFRISEVLINLLTNAINYTYQEGHVTVSVEDTDNEVITHVHDTGEGIPREALQHLFTKFFRVSGKLEQGSKGTGLGLYISKTIVEMHYGRIWVESEVGAGSTFSFSLPKSSYGSSKSNIN